MSDYVNTAVAFGDRKERNTKYFKENIAHLRSGWCDLGAISTEAEAKARILEAGLHKEKPKERHHVADPFGRGRRFKYGPLCEAKCKDTFCTLSTFDNSVGDSRFYGHADFKRLNIGVKSSRFDSCAMVPMYPKRCEIIMSYTDSGDFFICGLATIDVILKYSSMDHLNDINPALKERKDDRKLGFFGYDRLIPLHNYLTIPKLKELLKSL